MAATIVETPGDERFVMLPETDYRELVARAKARVPHDEVILPASVASRIFAGAPPVRALREWRALTARALATAAGVSAGHLADLESGRRQPSRDVAERLAAALGVAAEDLEPANMD